MADMSGLRNRKPPPVSVRYNIEVRARPVNGVAGNIATHCYLVLLDQGGEVVDSLSFDPNNSNGWKDREPENFSRGSVVLERNCELSKWNNLSESFKRLASSNPYVLGNHNCCHAVIDALIATNLNNWQPGVDLARVANNTWFDIHGEHPADVIEKKRI